MLFESISLHPIGARSIFFAFGAPLYFAYHGQVLGKTWNRQTAHWLIAKITTAPHVAVIDLQSQFGILLGPNNGYFNLPYAIF